MTTERIDDGELAIALILGRMVIADDIAGSDILIFPVAGVDVVLYREISVTPWQWKPLLLGGWESWDHVVVVLGYVDLSHPLVRDKIDELLIPQPRCTVTVQINCDHSIGVLCPFLDFRSGQSGDRTSQAMAGQYYFMIRVILDPPVGLVQDVLSCLFPGC